MGCTLDRSMAARTAPDGPDPLRLAHDDIHLWSANLDLPSREVAARAGCLSPDERDRAARFHFERDRRRFVVGRATLRIVLSRYGCGESSARLRLRYGANGKPALDRAQARHGPPIEFNLAHSQDLVLIAVAAGRALGVDVLVTRPGAFRIVRFDFDARPRTI